MSKIILLGYMGSGKSTIAALLAEKLNLPAMDLDHEIERRTGMSIPQIFDIKGEIWFRKTEHTILSELLDEPSDYILSLGGGTPCYAGNHLLITRPGMISVYLQASIDTLYTRLLPSLSSRPLLAQHPDTDLKEFIAKHLFERRHYYQMANFTIATDNKTAEATTSEIVALTSEKR